MNFEHKFCNTIPSPPHISRRLNGYSASDCLERKELTSSSISDHYLLGPLSARFPASSCISFILLRASISFDAREHECSLRIILSSHVPWHLRQGCCRFAACQTAGLFFASAVSQQYHITMGVHFRSLLFSMHCQTHCQQSAPASPKEMTLFRSAV